MAGILQMRFSNAYSSMNMFDFHLQFDGTLGLIDNDSALFQVMAWGQRGSKPLP